MMVLALSAPGSRIDLSIEGMHSQRFGVGVFFLLMLGIALFAGIILAVMRGSGGQKVTRTGEKLMFGAIISGSSSPSCLLPCRCCPAFCSKINGPGRRWTMHFSNHSVTAGASTCGSSSAPAIILVSLYGIGGPGATISSTRTSSIWFSPNRIKDKMTPAEYRHSREVLKAQEASRIKHLQLKAESRRPDTMRRGEALILATIAVVVAGTHGAQCQ
jgi:hypothetical protein